MTKKVARIYKKIAADENVYLKGSRIPLTFLFDYFIAGYTLTDFISSYPWVKKSDAVRKLEEIKEKATAINAF